MEKRWSADELAFAAKLGDYIERHRAEFEAKFAAKLGRPPTERELENFWMWEAMIEETAWEDFYGPPI